LRDGLKALGRREMSAPANWPAAESAVTARGDSTTRELATQIGQLFGDTKATGAQLAALRDATTAVPRRREILQAFARDAYAPALPDLLKLLDEPALRRDAIAGLAAFDDRRVAPELLRRYAAWPAAEKADAILTLAARASTATALFAELKKDAIPKRDISAFAARQLRQVIGPGFVDFWGSLSQPDDDKRAETMKLKLLLTDETLARANLANGRSIFERTCSACHTLYGEGGKIGPDITGSNRANLDYILNEILNPGEVIQEGYQLVTLSMRDGRMLAGNLASEDAQQVTLRMIGQEITVPKSEILAREVSPVSMMPEGLLKTLTSEETRDLIAYLRTTQQVPVIAKP
jgi:putative heme-binding domain-containing protein